MNLYQFVVDFIGEVPTEFQFIYVILTLVIAFLFFSTFISLLYWIVNLFKGAR